MRFILQDMHRPFILRAVLAETGAPDCAHGAWSIIESDSLRFIAEVGGRDIVSLTLDAFFNGILNVDRLAKGSSRPLTALQNEYAACKPTSVTVITEICD